MRLDLSADFGRSKIDFAGAGFRGQAVSMIGCACRCLGVVVPFVSVPKLSSPLRDGSGWRPFSL